MLLPTLQRLHFGTVPGIRSSNNIRVGLARAPAALIRIRARAIAQLLRTCVVIRLRRDQQLRAWKLSTSMITGLASGRDVRFVLVA